MNALLPIIADWQQSRPRNPALDCARAILTGDRSVLPATDHELYSRADWQNEAQCVVDCGGDTEGNDFLWQIGMELAFADFMALPPEEMEIEPDVFTWVQRHGWERKYLRQAAEHVTGVEA